MNRLLPYMRRYWIWYALGMLATVATATLAMVIPFLIRDAIDAIQAGHVERVARLAELMAGAALMMGGARWCSRFLVFNTGRDIEYDLRNDLFAHLQSLGPNFYQRVKTGDLMSRMVNDLMAVRMLVGMGVLTFTNTPLYYVYALAIMLSLNPRLTVASLLPYLVLLFGIRRLTRALMARSLKVQEGLGAIGAKVQESLAGVHVVKAHTLEEYEASQFKTLNDDYNRQGLALARLRGALMPMIRAAAATSAMIVLVYGGSQVMRRTMSLGDLVAFMSYLSLLAWPTTSLGWMLSIYQRGKAAMKRLGEIFDAQSIDSVAATDGRYVVRGDITWDHVSMSYFANGGHGDGSRQPYALKDVNVSVKAGQKLAIVGRTGAGKSTMVKMLARLIEPTDGRVTLDGCDLRDFPLRSLRRAVGLVPQESLLFSDTLAHNIAFGSVKAGIAEILSAARIAGLEGDIATLPHGLDTVVGERGMALSGGQKQRVTIARLLTYNPAVVVLDDALSSVDTETERAVLENLAESVRGRTTIVVSHRASTVRDADQIIVLEGGEIAERGTHERLMARRGIYAELFRRQLLEEELERY